MIKSGKTHFEPLVLPEFDQDYAFFIDENTDLKQFDISLLIRFLQQHPTGSVTGICYTRPVPAGIETISIDDDYRITSRNTAPDQPEGYVTSGITITRKGTNTANPLLGLPIPRKFHSRKTCDDSLICNKNQSVIDLNKALFLDRDGVINVDSGYPHLPEHITFVDGIFGFCSRFISKGYRIIVVTNQAGIAKGKYPETDIQPLHAWMASEFLKNGVEITDFAYCPYHAKGSIPRFARDSLLRKPYPGMILSMAEKWSIDISNSVMVGDKTSDRIRLPYLKSVIIRSKYTPEGFDAINLQQAADIILHP